MQVYKEKIYVDDNFLKFFFEIFFEIFVYCYVWGILVTTPPLPYSAGDDTPPLETQVLSLQDF